MCFEKEVKHLKTGVATQKGIKSTHHLRNEITLKTNSLHYSLERVPWPHI